MEEIYKIILKVSKLFTTDYMDLSHDVYLKLDHQKIQRIPKDRIHAYIYYSVRSVYLDQKRKQRPEISLDSIQIFDDILGYSKEYDYFSLLKSSPLTEIQKIQVDLYLDCDGQYREMARRSRVTRQTWSKKINEICKILTKYLEELD